MNEPIVKTPGATTLWHLLRYDLMALNSFEF